MVQAINTEIRTRFFEGAGQPGCMQKLRNLATTIKDAVLKLFQMILPCIFKKKAVPVLQTPAAPQTPPQRTIQATAPSTQPQVTQAVTTVAAAVVQPTQPQSRPAQTTQVLVIQPVVPVEPIAAPPVIVAQQPAPQPVAVVQAQQPVVPVQQPIVQPQVPVGNINEAPVQPANGHGPNGTLNRSLRILSEDSSDYKAAMAKLNGKNLEEKDNDEKEVISPLTEAVRELWSMGSLKRKQWLAKNTPGKTDVSGRSGLTPEQSKAAYFVILEAIELLCPKVKAGKILKPSDMDVVLLRGKSACKSFAQQGNGPLPYLDVLNAHNEYLTKVAVTRAKLGNVELDNSLRTDQAIQILVNNAKGKPLFASIVIAKEPANNPPIYGVVLQHDERSGTTDLHLIEPYGGGDGAIFFRKFSQNDLVKYLEVNKDTRYTCIGVEVND